MASQSSHRVVWLTALAWAAGLFLVTFLIRALIYYANLATNYAIDPFTNGYIQTLLVGPAAGGAFAGYWMARLLKRYAVFPSMRVLPVVLAWAFAMLLAAILPFVFSSLLFLPPEDLQAPSNFIIRILARTPLILLAYLRDFLGWLIPCTLAGLLLAWEIRRAGLRMRFGRMAEIAVGWGLAFAVGSITGSTIMGLVSRVWFGMSDPGWPLTDLVVWLSFGIAGLIGGAVGAAWTLLQVQHETAQPPAGSVPTSPAPVR